MMFHLFTADDWKEFRETNPIAYQHMTALSNRAERRSGHKELASKYVSKERREWLQRRVAELDYWHALNEEIRNR